MPHSTEHPELHQSLVPSSPATSPPPEDDVITDVTFERVADHRRSRTTFIINQKEITNPLGRFGLMVLVVMIIGGLALFALPLIGLTIAAFLGLGIIIAVVTAVLAVMHQVTNQIRRR